MAKKAVVATMLIHHDREQIQIGEQLDPKKFTEPQLLRLYERGAVKIVDESEVKARQEEKERSLQEVLSGTKTDEQAQKEEQERKEAQRVKEEEKAKLQQEAADAKKKAEEAARAAGNRR